MRVLTAKELGALVRHRRRERGLSQEELARRVGVSRKWVIGLEQGQFRAFGLVLQTLAELGLAMEVVEEDYGRGPVDLDEVLSRHEGGP